MSNCAARAGAPLNGETLAQYRLAAKTLRSVLLLADDAADAGDIADAAACLLGALDDLAPTFAALRIPLRPSR